MNKNTIIGLILILGIMITFSILTSPSKEEMAKMKREKDSLAEIKKQNEQINSDSIAKLKDNNIASNSSSLLSTNKDSSYVDSLGLNKDKEEFGMFASAAKGTEKLITIENEVIKYTFSNQGGKVTEVQLKKFKTYDSLPLILVKKDNSIFNFIFFANNRQINTSKLYFVPVITDTRFIGKDHIQISGNDSIKMAMRIYADSLNIPSQKKYIEIEYMIRGNDYMMKSDIHFQQMQDVLAENLNGIGLEWQMNLFQQEKSLKVEKMSSTIYYKFYEDEVDYLTETKDDQEDLTTKVNWIGYKQQFFSSVLIADKGFSNAKIHTLSSDTTKTEVKKCFSQITIPITRENSDFSMQLFFGPNHYKTLRKYDLDLERQIPLGWSSPYILGWINRFAVIPVFNWLESFGINYGIIILILTILLKVVLFPIAYKTYMSSAKMRVLKPEIDEINKKFSTDKAMERQQATMSLYKKAGVNPMAGCIPLVLQMPILIALYRFFPASIELRQKSFLWADDLSSYDSIYNLPFNIPFYGDHISLFCLLMTISTIIYTKVNNELMGNQQQMPGMKVMMYAMPVMFLGFFNDFASGLSYYYLLANLLTFFQMWVIRKFVNEDAIHAKIQENKKKPEKQKSGFQKRLEEMAKQKGYNPPKKK